MAFKVKESLDVYILVQKKGFAFLKYCVAIPFGRMILRTKSRDEVTAGNN